jgi:hypothetical protein
VVYQPEINDCQEEDRQEIQEDKWSKDVTPHEMEDAVPEVVHDLSHVAVAKEMN